MSATLCMVQNEYYFTMEISYRQIPLTIWINLKTKFHRVVIMKLYIITVALAHIYGWIDTYIHTYHIYILTQKTEIYFV